MNYSTSITSSHHPQLAGQDSRCTVTLYPSYLE